MNISVFVLAGFAVIVIVVITAFVWALEKSDDDEQDY